MDGDLKVRLQSEFALTDEQIGKLEAEGVVNETDMKSLTADDFKGTIGLGLVTARKIAAAFGGTPTVVPTAAHASTADPAAEIPEGTKPSPSQVSSFATSLGMDPGTLTMFMLAGATGESGMGALDISSMIPISQIVQGYNPKLRNMFLMVMGQIEKRLGVPIVVINGDGSTNRELTVEYIEGLEEGRDPAENNVYFDSAGVPYEVIRVGVDAQSIYDADPLDSTKALQKNGMGVGRVNWSGVPLEVKQVAFYAVTRTSEIDPANDTHLSWLRDHVAAGANRLIFQGQAPRAISEYNEALRTGSLPTLRVMLSRNPRRQEIMPRRRHGTTHNLAGIGRYPGESDTL